MYFRIERLTCWRYLSFLGWTIEDNGIFTVITDLKPFAAAKLCLGHIVKFMALLLISICISTSENETFKWSLRWPLGLLQFLYLIVLKNLIFLSLRYAVHDSTRLIQIE